MSFLRFRILVQLLTEEDGVRQGRVLTRGDRRRNERLARLRSIVRRDVAIVAVDLASAKQAAVVTDHDSVVLGRRMFSGDAWVIDDILDWAEPVAADAGFAGVVLGCEPTGHRWKPLLDRARARGREMVCVNPMLVHRGGKRRTSPATGRTSKTPRSLPSGSQSCAVTCPTCWKDTGAGCGIWARDEPISWS